MNSQSAVEKQGSLSGNDVSPQGFDPQGWPLPEVRSMMVDNFAQSWIKHWIAAIVIFILTVGIVIIATILTTPTWEGTATVLVTQTSLPKLNITATGTEETSTMQTGMLARNLTELVHDHALQYDVIDETGMDKYLEERSHKWRDRVKDGIKYVLLLKFLYAKPINWRVKAKKELDSKWLLIAPTEGTSKLPLYVYGSNPEWTVKIGNAVLEKVQEYMDRSMRLQVTAELDTVGTLKIQAEKDLNAIEQKITDYRQQTGFVNPLSYANAMQGSLNTVEQQSHLQAAQLTGLQQSIKEMKAELDGYEPFVKMSREGTQVRMNDQGSQRVARDLAELKSQRAALVVSMKTNSPQVLALDQQIEEMGKQLVIIQKNEKANEGTSTTVTRDWDPRYKSLFDRWLDGRQQEKMAQAKLDGLTSAITTMKDNQRKAIQADTVIRQMTRQMQLRLDDLNNLNVKKQSFETMLAQDHIFSGMQVIEKMSVNTPDQPDRPNRLLAAILGVAIGLFMALVLPVAYDYLNQTLLSSRQASAIPGIRLAAVVPKMSMKKMTKSVGY